MASGVIPTAGYRVPPLRRLKGLGQTTDSSADVTRLGGAIVTRAAPLSEPEAQAKAEAEGEAGGGIGLCGGRRVGCRRALWEL